MSIGRKLSGGGKVGLGRSGEMGVNLPGTTRVRGQHFQTLKIRLGSRGRH